MILDRPTRLTEEGRAYDDLRGMLSLVGDAALAERRETAIAAFERSGWPTRRDEEFRYLPLAETVHPRRTGFASNLERADVPLGALEGLNAVVVAFVNGLYAPELSTFDVLPEGFSIRAFSEAEGTTVEGLGTIASYFERPGRTNDERFAHLNTAMFLDGVEVAVAPGVEIERPLLLLHVTDARDHATSAYPRAVIRLGENASLKVVEASLALGEGAFVVPVTEVSLARDARLTHVLWQDLPLDAVQIARTAVAQAENSFYRHLNLQLGAHRSRLDLDVFTSGPRTETRLDGASLVDGDRVVDAHTRIDHAVPDGGSFEVYRSVLAGQGAGVFNGKIFVYPDAQRTDAKQTNKALLLSPDAAMYTKPQLEIYADDVKCTHGATIGHLPMDQLFYLRARGIPEAEARAMLLRAFLAESWQNLGFGAWEETLNEEISRRLERLG